MSKVRGYVETIQTIVTGHKYRSNSNNISHLRVKFSKPRYRETRPTGVRFMCHIVCTNGTNWGITPWVWDTRISGPRGNISSLSYLNSENMALLFDL